MLAEIKRTISLQTDDITAKKANALKMFVLYASDLANWMLMQRTSQEVKELHRKVYREAKSKSGFNSQVIIDIERNIVKTKSGRISGITVKFNVPRNAKMFYTKTKLFVELGLRPKQRIAVPIKQNANFERFRKLLADGWTCKTFGLTPRLEIVAYLSAKKDVAERPNVVGVDTNAGNMAVTVLSKSGKILYQTYLAQNIWNKRKKIIDRRSLLQSFRARKKLKRIKRYEHNYTKTAIGQTVSQIIALAERFDADIAIEKLSKFKPKSRRFNQKVMRIPFYLFRRILEQRCFDHNLNLYVVDAWHTSKWCSHCGAVASTGHAKDNYSLFKCTVCGQVVNSDRKASLAIAVKALSERNKLPNQEFFQFSERRVPVSGLLRCPSAPGLGVAVPLNPAGEGKAPSFSEE